VKISKLTGMPEEDQIAINHPKNIGFSRPAGTFDYEFLICGRDVPFTQNQIVDLFIRHGAMILALDGSRDEYGEKFTLSLCCNLEHSELGPMDLAVRLQRMKHVISADYCELKGRLFGRLAGISFNNNHAAIALNSDTLLSLGRRLAKDTGSIGTSVLTQEGREYAHGVVREIRHVLKSSLERERGSPLSSYGREESDREPEPTVEGFCMKCREMREVLNPSQVILSNKSQALLGVCAVCATKVFKFGAKVYGKIRGGLLIENVQAFFRASGWGTFEIRENMDGRFGTVTILDSPNFERDIDNVFTQGNQFVEGIAAGFLEAVSMTRNKMILIGEKYDRPGRALTLHFVEQIPFKTKNAKLPTYVATRRVRKQQSAKIRKKSRKPSEIQVDSSIEKSTETEPYVGQQVMEVDRIIRSLEKIEPNAQGSTREKQEAQTIAEPVLPQTHAGNSSS
jgi:hypothetical protein